MIDKLAEFVYPYYDEEYTPQIRAAIKKHLEYGTCDYALDSSGDVVAIVLWNMKDGMTRVHVRDLIIRKDWRGRFLFKDFVARAIKRFPTLKTISFLRERKYKDRVLRTYDIRKFLWRKHE